MPANGNFASFDLDGNARKRDIEPKISRPLIPAGQLSRKKLGKVTKPKSKGTRRP